MAEGDTFPKGGGEAFPFCAISEEEVVVGDALMAKGDDRESLLDEAVDDGVEALTETAMGDWLAAIASGSEKSDPHPGPVRTWNGLASAPEST